MADANVALIRYDANGQNPVTIAYWAIGSNGIFVDTFVDHPPGPGTWSYAIYAVPGPFTGGPAVTDFIVGRTAITAMVLQR